jgi:hypothetical protein
MVRTFSICLHMPNQTLAISVVLSGGKPHPHSSLLTPDQRRRVVRAACLVGRFGTWLGYQAPGLRRGRAA